MEIRGPVVAPGDTVRISMADPKVPLSNKGGTINLFAPDRTLVHGVAYTRDQVSAQGWTITF